MLLLKGIFLSIFLIQSIYCHPDGAGAESCVTMEPLHGFGPQVTPAPFTVTPSATSVSQGQMINIVITRTHAATALRGFVIQARNAANVAVGQFFLTTGMRELSCANFGVGSVATHSDPTARVSITVVWTAPNNFVGGVVFRVTALQDFATFWTNIVSPTVTVTA